MNKVTAVFGHGIVKAIFFVGIVAAVLVGGVPSATVNQALAAPQSTSRFGNHLPGRWQIPGRATPQARPVTCAPPVCRVPGKLVCEQPDGCPGGCGVKCVVLPVTPTVTQPVARKVIELPELTMSENEKEITFDIRKMQAMLTTGETLETELLTKDKKSYAGALADFYALADKLCHVATLSPDMALAQQCSPTTKSLGLQEWSSAITYLSGIAQGVRPDMRSASSYAAFVRSNPGAVYLIVKGRSVIAAAVKDLQGVMNGTVRMANALPIEFEGCTLPQQASGDQLSKVCHSALPVPPLMVSTKDGKLVLARQTEGEASVIVQINTRVAKPVQTFQVNARAPKRTPANPVAYLPVHVQPASSPKGDPYFYNGECRANGGGKYCGCVVGFQKSRMPRFEKFNGISEADCEVGKIKFDGYTVFKAVRYYYPAESSSSSSVSSSSKSSSSSSSVSSSSKTSSSSSSSSSSSVSSSSKSSSSSTDTTSTTEEATTTTEVKPSSGFFAHCGGNNEMAGVYHGPNIHRVLVGNFCRQKSIKQDKCYYDHSTGSCGTIHDVLPESLCASFCANIKERLAKADRDREAAFENCDSLIKKNNRSIPAEAGHCPGKCEVEGTTGCVNPDGAGDYEMEFSGQWWVYGSQVFEYNYKGNACANVYCTISNGVKFDYSWNCTDCVFDASSLSSESSSSSSSEAPSTTVEETSTTVRETTTTVEETSTTVVETTTTSDESSSSFSSSSASEKIYACMCDGKDGAGRVVRSESSPSTQSECGSFCPASQRDKDGWCTKTDGFGTTSKVRNCKWELTDPPLN